MKEKITINSQSSIRIEDNNIIYFDPYNIEYTTNDADLIFITHDHYDHLDINSIDKIIKDTTTIVLPKSIYNNLDNYFNNKNIILVEPNNTYNILNYKIETIPSYNINKPYHKIEYGYLGYIITINDERIYISGDTDITEENKNIKCDIALIPIGGTYTMDYIEAANLINIIKPKTVIPTHYSTIVGTLEDGTNFKNLLNKDIECILLIK